MDFTIYNKQLNLTEVYETFGLNRISLSLRYRNDSQNMAM